MLFSNLKRKYTFSGLRAWVKKREQHTILTGGDARKVENAVDKGKRFRALQVCLRLGHLTVFPRNYS